MFEVDEVVKMSQAEIVLSIPQMSAHEKSALARAELARSRPRSGVLKALGMDGEDVASIDKDAPKRVVETLDMGRPFESVWFEDSKHFLQDGKIFDSATAEVIHAPAKENAAKEPAAKK